MVNKNALKQYRMEEGTAWMLLSKEMIIGDGRQILKEWCWDGIKTKKEAGKEFDPKTHGV